ncbi:MAG: hypothetical protein LBE35_01650 [Clostridiales bacterium]|jgi:hypothetical protein|nr:hypothetical protein [Clostridiales bacterium]
MRKKILSFMVVMLAALSVMVVGASAQTGDLCGCYGRIRIIDPPSIDPD